jgi:dodecin
MTVVTPERTEVTTAVGKVIELTAESPESFEDAIRCAIAKAEESVHGIKGAWVKEQQVRVVDGEIVGFRVDLKITFLVD